MTEITTSGRGLPVVDRWFSSLEVTETLTVISEPYVHPLLRPTSGTFAAEIVM